jgi:hypothetical protein
LVNHKTLITKNLKLNLKSLINQKKFNFGFFNLNNNKKIYFILFNYLIIKNKIDYNYILFYSNYLLYKYLFFLTKKKIFFFYINFYIYKIRFLLNLHNQYKMLYKKIKYIKLKKWTQFLILYKLKKNNLFIFKFLLNLNIKKLLFLKKYKLILYKWFLFVFLFKYIYIISILARSHINFNSIIFFLYNYLYIFWLYFIKLYNYSNIDFYKFIKHKPKILNYSNKYIYLKIVHILYLKQKKKTDIYPFFFWECLYIRLKNWISNSAYFYNKSKTLQKIDIYLKSTFKNIFVFLKNGFSTKITVALLARIKTWIFKYLKEMNTKIKSKNIRFTVYNRLLKIFNMITKPNIKASLGAVGFKKADKKRKWKATQYLSRLIARHVWNIFYTLFYKLYRIIYIKYIKYIIYNYVKMVRTLNKKYNLFYKHLILQKKTDWLLEEKELLEEKGLLFKKKMKKIVIKSYVYRLIYKLNRKILYINNKNILLNVHLYGIQKPIVHSFLKALKGWIKQKLWYTSHPRWNDDKNKDYLFLKYKYRKRRFEGLPKFQRETRKKSVIFKFSKRLSRLRKLKHVRRVALKDFQEVTNSKEKLKLLKKYYKYKLAFGILRGRYMYNLYPWDYLNRERKKHPYVNFKKPRWKQKQLKRVSKISNQLQSQRISFSGWITSISIRINLIYYDLYPVNGFKNKKYKHKFR